MIILDPKIGLTRVVVPETTDVVFEENQGKLVLVAGPLEVPDSLSDDRYGVSIRAVKLKKVVQVYQWYQIEDRPAHAAAASPGGNPEIADHGDHGQRC